MLPPKNDRQFQFCANIEWHRALPPPPIRLLYHSIKLFGRTQKPTKSSAHPTRCLMKTISFSYSFFQSDSVRPFAEWRAGGEPRMKRNPFSIRRLSLATPTPLVSPRGHRFPNHLADAYRLRLGSGFSVKTNPLAHRF